MLNEKSAAIIMICKNRFSDDTQKLIEEFNLDTVEAIRWWVASYTGMPLIYSEHQYVKHYLRDAIIDVINNHKNPGMIFTRVFELIDKGYDELHSYISVLKMLQVRESSDTFINGFTEELIRPVEFYKEV